MKNSPAYEIFTNIMSSGVWNVDGDPAPSTSNDSIEPTIRLNANDEFFDSFYSDEGSNPPWMDSVVEVQDESNSTDVDVFQDSCYTATSRAESVSDVVKVELKSRIQKKRLDSGKRELQVNFEQPTHDEKLSEEERKQREERREKNRLAAQKCREKKQKKIDYLENNIERLENRRLSLQDEVQRLQDEREHLEEVIKVHHIVCPKIRKLNNS